MAKVETLDRISVTIRFQVDRTELPTQEAMDKARDGALRGILKHGERYYHCCQEAVLIDKSKPFVWK